MKPLDTLAREFFWFLTGEERGAGELLDLLSRPESYERTPIFAVRDRELLKSLRLDARRDRFSPAEILERTTELDARAMEAARRPRDPDPADRAALELWDRHEQYRRMIQGRALRILRFPSGESGLWPSVWELGEFLDGRDLSPALRSALSGAPRDRLEAVRARYRELRTARAAGQGAAYADAGKALAALLGEPERAPDLELRSNRLDLQTWALRGYFAAFALFVLSAACRPAALRLLGPGLLGAVLAVHVAALVLRGVVAGRVPFSNLYESMSLLAALLAFLGLVLGLATRAPLFGLIASLLSGALLAFDRANTAINPFVTTVPPALQSFWMQVHVPTIIAAYACSFLLMGLGVASLSTELFARTRDDLRERLDGHLHRTLQLTVLFFVAGISLGAVWAGEAWGRYWGWDLKEIWALAALFWYLATAHARIAGRLRGFGTAVAAVLGFLIVLLNYYGVNFLFGRGLHTYGFGQGSAAVLIAAFAALGLLVVAAAAARFRRA